MDGITCDFCGKPIASLDFYLTIKGGALCPDCLLLGRGKNDAPHGEPHTTPHDPVFPLRGEALFSPPAARVLF
ncbi:MAG: hypothetical protein AB7D57_06875 [Desulfovibrionaceae bacterium]